MKKALIILLVGITVLLPSCGKKVKKESVTPLKPSCTVGTSFNGTDYSAKVHYSDTGVLSIEMIKPLKGLTLCMDDSGCRLGYNGTELDCTATRSKNLCPFIGLYSVLKTVCYTVPESARADGESYILKYRTPELECTAKSSIKDGTLSEIDVRGLKFIFK